MDCLEGMRRFLDDGEVDVIVTSPPYNLGIKYNSTMTAFPENSILIGWKMWQKNANVFSVTLAHSF